MNKLSFFLIILILSPIFFLYNQETKLIKTGKQYLVVIALDKYKNRLPLQDRVKDAKDIKKSIYSKYEVDELLELYDFDATNKNINEIFLKLQREVKKDDSVLIYYSGHGFIDKRSNDVYWLPYDAGINEYIRELWLSSNNIIKTLNIVKAKRIFVISDSCFNTNLIEPIILEKKIDFSNEYFTDSYSKESRQFLCSGELETGLEKSEFSEQLAAYLKFTRKKHIDPVMIYDEIKDKMKRSVPVYGVVRSMGHKDNASLVLFQREKELKIIEDEYVSKEPEKEPTKELENDPEKEPKERIIYVTPKFTPFKDLSPINKTGRVILITSAPICGIGLGLLFTDFAFMFSVLNQVMNEGESYETYVRAYNIHIYMFISSVVVASIGLIGIIVSIPLNVIKGDFSKADKDKITLNINYNLEQDLSLYFRYRF